MKPKLIFLGLGGTLAGSVAFASAFLACSSSTPATAGNPEGGSPDAPFRAMDQGITFFDVSSADNTVGSPEGGGSDVRGRDAEGKDAGEAGMPMVIDAGPLAACSPIVGQCDIVSQNCSSGSECVLFQAQDGSFTTGCETNEPSERLPSGTACCPTESNPCKPGLECNGGNNCVDASSPGPGLPPGWGGSRCAPHCCPADSGPNTANCGLAGDGGAVGQCNLTIVDNNDNSLYTICTYPQLCEPFHIVPCPAGFSCTPSDSNGTAECTIIFNPNGDAGLTAGQACGGNDCADGLTCIITGADGGSMCLWNCFVPGQTMPPQPFDAGRLTSAPGYGGCPSGQTCGGVTGFPDWLGVCNP